MTSDFPRSFDNVVRLWKSLPLRSKRFILIGSTLVGLVDLIALTYDPLLTTFAYLFRVDDPLVQSDAIVILLGNSYDRTSKAAELYRQGLAPVILMGPAPITELETQFQVLTQAEVPMTAIHVMPGEVVRTTYDEAIRMRDYVRSSPLKTVTVVTSAYHTARTRWIFKKLLRPLGVNVRMVASQDFRFTESDWYAKRDGINQYVLETLKSLYYRIAY